MLPEDVARNIMAEVRRKGVPVMFFGTIECSRVPEEMLRKWDDGVAAGYHRAKTRYPTSFDAAMEQVCYAWTTC